MADAYDGTCDCIIRTKHMCVLLHSVPGSQKTQEEQARLHRALKAEVEAQVRATSAWACA